MPPLSRIDLWIGKRLFHPPIIWFCQRSGMTQWAMASYCWIAAAFTLVARISISVHRASILWAFLVTLMALSATLRAGVAPDKPRLPQFGIRLFCLALLVLVCVSIFGQQKPVDSDEILSLAWNLFALTAEYAATITTIPPRSAKGQMPAGSSRQAQRFAGEGRP